MDWNKRITPKDAQKMMNAYSKVYAPKEEPDTEKVDTEEEIVDQEAEYYENGGTDDSD